MKNSRRIVGILLLIIVSSVVNAETGGKAKVWTGTWATAPQLVEPNNMPPSPGLSNNTLRQIVRVSMGGNLIRLKFSNLFGKQPVTMKSVTVAVPKEGCVIEASSQKMVLFHGRKHVTMNPGAEIISDPLKYKLKPGSRVAITIAFAETAPEITGHPGSRTTSYILEGDQVRSTGFAGAIAVDHWYIITGIDVQTSSKSASVVVLGNSITDGRGSGTNRQNRWTDVLSEQLLKSSFSDSRGVLNLGIGGNCVVRGGLGLPALQRFDRDVLSQNNVRWLIILEGVNDIGGIRRPEDAPKMIQDLIEAYSKMIDKAHDRGLKVYGATILPFSKSFYDKDFRLAVRDTINHWIRSSGRFDAVIDFDKLMCNPENPQVLLPDVHTGDFLHPNEAGYRKMGEFVDLELFR